MPKEYICKECKKVFNDPSSNGHDCDCIELSGKCTDCSGHCPVCYLDMKEQLASVIFDFEYEDMDSRPNEQECHVLAEQLMFKCHLCNEYGQDLWKGYAEGICKKG